MNIAKLRGELGKIDEAINRVRYNFKESRPIHQSHEAVANTLLNNAQRDLQVLLDEFDVEMASEIKEHQKGCKHPYEELFFEIDNNGGTIAMCLACGKETTELLPEYA